MTTTTTERDFPHWLRPWAVGTVALAFALLALGAVVTSFRVGMADPIWPTEPWRLATIDWSEASAGFLIEHVHRLAGFAFGGVVAILALGLWATEPRQGLRYAGLAAMVGLLAAFGQLHGSLIKLQRVGRETGEFLSPDWATVAGPTLGCLAVLALAVAASLSGRVAGTGVRVLGVAVLIAAMLQGMLGGLRVYLNVQLGTDLATIHGSFAQIVVALAVAVAVGLRRDVTRTSDRSTSRLAVVTAVLLYGQIVFGAVLRHTTSPLGPRSHLLGAFASLAAVVILARHLRSSDTTPAVRRLRIVLHSLIGLQVLLGIEAWMGRFANGIAAAPFQAVTVWDALLRTVHALSGYALFAAAVALALHLRPTRVIANRPAPRRSVAELETVA